MSRIAIVGPGAVGSVLAAILHAMNRHDLTLCARRPVPRLQVRTVAGDVAFAPRVLTNPAEAHAVDWVLVSTKAHDSTAAARWLPRLIAEGARVAIVQNGVEHRERFRAFVPEDRLVPVMIDCPAERSPVGVVQRALARLVIADDANGHAFAALFAHPAIAVTFTDDLKTALWRKLCLNAAGVISALVDQPAGVMRREEAILLCRRIVAEVVAVGRAEGAQLPEDMPDQIVAACANAPADGINSLHADRRAGRQTEIDARNGVIVRLGRQHGIATPYNEMAAALIALITPTLAPT
jgi:2-dehydropantoate 2-reductase